MEQEKTTETMPTEPAWETSTAGMVTRYFATIKGMIPRCDFFFDKFSPIGKGIVPPTIFLSIGAFLASLTHTLFAVFILPRFGIQVVQGIQTNAALHTVVGTVGLTVAILAVCYLLAFIHHLLILDTKKPFIATYRIAAYSFGVAILFSIIPLYGILLTGFLGYTYQIYGLTRVQKVNGNLACFAVLCLPVVLIILFTLWYNNVFPFTI